ncbi:Hydrolase activity protein [Homalodisca vitripennis]|nr:Hydrolase activity protein [Homalodisca vitripennis]
MCTPVFLCAIIVVTSAASQYKTTRYSSSNGYSYSYSGSWSNSWSGNSGSSHISKPVQTVFRPVQSFTPVLTSEVVEPLKISNVNEATTLEFLNPSGVRISVAGPYPESSSYTVKFHLNLNHGFNGAKTGDYNKELTLAPGSTWSYTFPDIQPRGGESVHYLVEVNGRNGNRWWSRDYTGFYQLPQRVTTQGSWSVQIKPGSSGVIQNIPYAVEQKPIYYPSPKPTRPVVDYTPAPRPVVDNTPRPVVDNRPVPRPTVVQEPQSLGNRPPSKPQTDNSPPRVGDQQVCPLSLTTFNNGKRACAGRPVVTKFPFNSIEQIAGYEPEELFTIFLHKNALRNNQSDYYVTTIFPSLLEEECGQGCVDRTFSLKRCTSRNPNLCSATGKGYFILPPILSGRETTMGTLSFCYGTLEVNAKLPVGDWVVPELWLLPKDRKYGASSGRIVMAMSRGNQELSDGVQDHSSRVLEAGVVTSAGSQMFRTEQLQSWSDSYHRFKVVWTPDRIEFYADDKKLGQVQPLDKLDPSIGGGKMAPFDQEFYLSFGVHVGGDKDFPDSLRGKPWANGDPKNKLNFWKDRQKWLSTWNDGTALQIAGVTLTALS